MSFTERFKQSFLSGLVIVTPLLITLLIIKVLADWTFKLISPIIESTNLTQYTAYNELFAQIIAITFVVSLITFIGYISNYTVGTRIRGFLLKVIEDIPLFGTIYTTIQQISSSFTDRGSKFKKLVLVEFPREGIYSIGLLTSEAPEKIEEETEKGEKLSSIYIPHSPNPTMGNLIMAPESQYTVIDMSVQKGMKLILTTGIGYEKEEIPKNIRQKHEEFFQ